MATKGRPPNPLTLKLINGEPNKDRINLDEPANGPAPADPPKSLKGAKSRQKWREMREMLSKSGVLQNSDTDLLATYCRVWAASLDPDLTVAQLLAISRELRAMASLFGLSPSDRQRITVDKKTPADDDMEAMFAAQ